MPEQTYQAVPVASLIEHPQNPRRGNVGVIEESIDRLGFYGAVIVQRSTRHVLAGNHRLRAAIAKGLDEIPAIIVDVDDDTAKRIMLVDNRSSDLAVYADAELASLLQELGDLIGTGYADVDLDDILARLDPPTLEDLGREHGDELSDDDRLVTVSLRLEPDLALRLREALAAMPGDSDTARVGALLDRLNVAA